MFWGIMIVIVLVLVLVILVIYKLLKLLRESIDIEHNIYTFRSIGFTRVHASENTDKLIEKWSRENPNVKLIKHSKSSSKFWFLFVKYKKKLIKTNKEPN